MDNPTGSFLYHRHELASRLADDLTGRGPFSYTSGLFLAAPRWTGKSTFMRDDLRPALTQLGVLTTYVDLWEDKQRDPAQLIAEALKTTLRGLDSWGAKALRKSGIAKISVAGALTFDVDKVGAKYGATLTEAFKAIVTRTGKPTALIVDEAQQALATTAGMDAMFALKAARDALNQGGAIAGGPALLMVFTGSHRDKLANLVLKRDQPFFGATITDFPRLGRDYTDAYTDWLHDRLAANNRFDKDQVWAAFQVLGHRPEKLEEVLRYHAFGPAKAAGLAAELADDARDLRERNWEEYDGEFSGLSPLQRAILGRLIELDARFVPFAAASLAAYAEDLGRPVTASEAQGALDALRTLNIVWRNGRSAYALEDQGMVDWFRARYFSQRA